MTEKLSVWVRVHAHDHVLMAESFHLRLSTQARCSPARMPRETISQMKSPIH